MMAFIDRPAGIIDGFSFTVLGWVAAETVEVTVRLTANGVALAHFRYDRPDVRAAMPDCYSTGIAAHANLLDLPPSAEVYIELACGDYVARHRVEITGELLAASARESEQRERARQWCLERLRCPVCQAGRQRLSIAASTIRCEGCGTGFPQHSTTINMIGPEKRSAYSVPETINVSAHVYEPWAQALIERVTAAGGVVLDCGAGSRQRRTPGVINVEIVDYASTDVLAFGEALPFADNQFDGVLSLAVLEHVRDPFACAYELVRVAKPGASIIASVPFLQPVHAYPDHYYNMTAQGLLNLFGERVDVVEREVPLHGHPIWALRWIAREYLDGLPDAIRADFGALTMRDVASLDFDWFLGSPAVTELNRAAGERIACLNTAHLRKKA